MTELVNNQNLQDGINGLLNNVITKHLKLSYLLVDLGRKELEERILKKVKAPKKKPIPKPRNSGLIKMLTNSGQQKMMKNWNCFFVKGKR